MPVRSLTSSVLKWPDAAAVERAVVAWAADLEATRPELLRVAIFGSYARGDWGVGSDLDLLIVVTDSDLPFVDRPLEWDTTGLPVPVDVLVYTESECLERSGRGDRFARTLESEARWIYERGPARQSA